MRDDATGAVSVTQRFGDAFSRGSGRAGGGAQTQSVSRRWSRAFEGGVWRMQHSVLLYLTGECR